VVAVLGVSGVVYMVGVVRCEEMTAKGMLG